MSQLMDLRRHAEDYLRRDGFVAEDEFFYAEQNARLVANAEHYYRSMFQGRVSPWNFRDRHMAETLAALLAHLGKRMRHPKIVRAVCDARRLEQAIGVMYLPNTERLSHYFYAALPAQFDAVLRFDETHGVKPLDRDQDGSTKKRRKRFPTGI